MPRSFLVLVFSLFNLFAVQAIKMESDISIVKESVVSIAENVGSI